MVNTIYLDNSATTKPLKEVMQAFMTVNEQYYANPASIHAMGVESNDLLMRAREQVADILQTEAKYLLFTSGGTESNNAAIFGIAHSNTHIGKHILTTEIEHPSVLETVKQLEKEGYDVEYLHVNQDGVISLDDLRTKIRKDTILVSIMHVNNEMGAVQPIYEAAKIIHEMSRAFLHVDAVQSFGKLAVSFKGEEGPDCISISGHKIHGFKGSGVLAFRKKLKWQPYALGGGQEFGLRSGTVAVPQAVALAKAARLAVETMKDRATKYRQWQNEIRAQLEGYGEAVHILSTPQGAAHILSFSVRDLKGEVIINAMQKRGIIVSTSSACSSKQTKTSHVVEALHLDEHYKKGVIRISFGAHNTVEDIEQLKQVLAEVIMELKGEIM
ncbi:cysteine desulfurase family protein [Lysinibacillus irui]|uniref:Cysteine desulfurase family protein n=1 Tax=Lysinibacillus irui TaxID=2998077 RepID=A0ABU5NM61_9BACI|nr:cysteine desulfurase family protein [Lysinibacillus irui]MEA0555496.1 cysteine desulfurase family protein [Lysinibacillus irui]MEA0977081.1 cysteine desulfurase family protein [Lysinibacillus irui]MEA1043235.1 cysteine desulfurase family protein [Lysinibacillus irui]